MLPRRRGPSAATGPIDGVAGGVKVETPAPTTVALPPPCSSWTPVKSPDQKKPKSVQPAPVAGQAGGVALKRSLCAEMDEAKASEVPTQMDSSLGSKNDSATRLNLLPHGYSIIYYILKYMYIILLDR